MPIIVPPIPPIADNHINVVSTNPNTPAVGATTVGTGGIGVSGSGEGVGVFGQSGPQIGVKGSSSSFDAVVGETESDAHAGVTGRNLTTGAHGGVGIYGTGGLYAGKFDGDLQVNGNAKVTQTLTVGVDVVLSGADCAEEFDIRTGADTDPGTVMVIDESGRLLPSERAYDKRVAGVISGAGKYRPGLILDRAEPSPDRLPIALVGKVYCKVDAQFGAIQFGDLLTTSPTAGHAMRADDPFKAFGSVIGKALQSLSAGQTGMIPILVALQ